MNCSSVPSSITVCTVSAKYVIVVIVFSLLYITQITDVAVNTTVYELLYCHVLVTIDGVWIG
jgi:hypothetical protein